jgi:carboxymethylenebutenolidase
MRLPPIRGFYVGHRKQTSKSTPDKKPTISQDQTMSDITITTDDGSFTAYLAEPKTPNGHAIVVIQEIFGVNKVMRDLTDYYSSLGFVALCPDLFWRQEPGIDITDQTKEEWDKAFALYSGFNVDKGITDIAATIATARSLASSGKVATVGYCLGGLLTYLSMTRTDADAGVSFYGVGIDQKLDDGNRLSKPTMLHIASDDSFVSKTAQAAIVAALSTNPQATIHQYEGLDHAFAREGGAHYDDAGATLANQRTAAFLDAALS